MIEQLAVALALVAVATTTAGPVDDDPGRAGPDEHRPPHAVCVPTGKPHRTATCRVADVSADGRLVALVSSAPLVPEDDNEVSDAYVHDRQTGTTVLVSRALDGTAGDRWSDLVRISADGRYLVFRSAAADLVPGDDNDTMDVFLHDRQLGRTELVSRLPDGGFPARASGWPDVSADGRYVVFSSESDRLVRGDDDGQHDAFVLDRQRDRVELVARRPDGSASPAWSLDPVISDDGRYVAFVSPATDLVDVPVAEGTYQVYGYDRRTERVELISRNEVESADVSADHPAVSHDGRFVAFHTAATNLAAGDRNRTTDVFVRDRGDATTTLVSTTSRGRSGDDFSRAPSISADGRLVAFESRATDLVEGDNQPYDDVFVRDLVSGRTTMVSVDHAGGPADEASVGPEIAAGGGAVAFTSSAQDLADWPIRESPTGWLARLR